MLQEQTGKTDLRIFHEGDVLELREKSASTLAYYHRTQGDKRFAVAGYDVAGRPVGEFEIPTGAIIRVIECWHGITKKR